MHKSLHDISYINVVVNNSLRKVFVYAITSAHQVEVGGIVSVDFAGKVQNAVVVETNVKPHVEINRIKWIKSVICKSYFSRELFNSLKVLADYNAAPLGAALFTALPTNFRNYSKNDAKQQFLYFSFSSEFQSIFNQGTSILNARQDDNQNDKQDYNQERISYNQHKSDTQDQYLDLTDLASQQANEFYQLALSLLNQVDSKVKARLKNYLKEYGLDLNSWKLIQNLYQYNSYLSKTFIANLEQTTTIAIKGTSLFVDSLSKYLSSSTQVVDLEEFEQENKGEFVIHRDEQAELTNPNTSNNTNNPNNTNKTRQTLKSSLNDQQGDFTFANLLDYLDSQAPIVNSIVNSIDEQSSAQNKKKKIAQSKQQLVNHGYQSFIKCYVQSAAYEDIYIQNKSSIKINITSKAFLDLLKKGYINLEFIELYLSKQANNWQASNTLVCLDNFKHDRTSLVNLDNKLTLNQAQQEVYNTIISSQGYNAFLIDGVTGSGKTEVYLQLIEQVLLNGQSCLVLVPEIGLTPQTVERFRSRFNVPIRILHSNITDANRNKINYDCLQGQVAILIGTRSAVFAQLQNLGCIIIDEEHDQSYKQQNDFRYHARDLAMLRASNLNIPIVLGSATPSFNTIYNCSLGKIKRLVIGYRAQALHKVDALIIDLAHQNFLGEDDRSKMLNAVGISHMLWQMMFETFEQGNQVLIFLNRRGYSPQLQCHDCGYLFLCDECDRPYTYHKSQHLLKCHHCFTTHAIAEHCPHCHSTNLQLLGAGTEKIAEICGQAYNPEKIIRIDRDTTKNIFELEENLNKIHNTPGALLIGTQMLAKGHHFPDVTLVGLLNIDALVKGSDYRSTEKLAQLYTQVAGRAGRASKKGCVVLQTSYPNDEIYFDLFNLSYYDFALKQLRQRQIYNLPPFSKQAYIGIRHKSLEVVKASNVLINQLITQAYELYVQQNINLAYTSQQFSQQFLQQPSQQPSQNNHSSNTNYQQLPLINFQTHDLGKQSNLYKWVVDIIVGNRDLRQYILNYVSTNFIESQVYKKFQPVFYIDVDPIDLY